MRKSRKAGILSETYPCFERTVKNGPPFLPGAYANRFSSSIQLKKLWLFQAFIIGLITDTKGGTLTHLYQASASQTRYWSFPKFLSRGKWDADALAAHLIRYIQQTFGNSVYVYDETKALKTGTSQYGLHFFRNFSYQKRRVNQSKFHYGHEFGALGLLCATTTQWLLFPVWVKLIAPQTLRDKKDAVLKRICSKLPRGLILFDRVLLRPAEGLYNALRPRTSSVVSRKI